MVWFVGVLHSVIGCGMVWCGLVWFGVVGCCMVWYGVVWRGLVWCGLLVFVGVWHGLVWCGVAYGVVWHGVVWCGVVWCGVVSVWHYFLIRSLHFTSSKSSHVYTLSSTDSSPFWPALKCLIILIERLGSRMWFECSPSEFFLTITEHGTYKVEISKWNGYQGNEGPLDGHISVDSDDDHVSSSQTEGDTLVCTSAGRKSFSVEPQKSSLGWLLPFVQSLLDFGEMYRDCVSQVIYHARSLSGTSSTSQTLALTLSCFSARAQVPMAHSRKDRGNEPKSSWEFRLVKP